MEAFFLNNAKNLFTIYHEPKGSLHTNYGVILCYPIGQEYIRCHRLYYLLSEKLSAEGFHVFRFDYGGTGDSEDNEDYSIENYLDDLFEVYKELKETGMERIIIIGARFGACIASLFAQKTKVEGVCLLSPVIRGEDYLDEMTGYQKNWLINSFAKLRSDSNSFENLGFQFSWKFIDEIKKLDLKTVNLGLSRVFVIGTRDLQLQQFLDVLNAKGNKVDFEPLLSHNFWIKQSGEDFKTLIPVFEIESIINWAKRISR